MLLFSPAMQFSASPLHIRADIFIAFPLQPSAYKAYLLCFCNSNQTFAYAPLRKSTLILCNLVGSYLRFCDLPISQLRHCTAFQLSAVAHRSKPNPCTSDALQFHSSLGKAIAFERCAYEPYSGNCRVGRSLLLTKPRTPCLPSARWG